MPEPRSLVGSGTGVSPSQPRPQLRSVVAHRDGGGARSRPPRVDHLSRLGAPTAIGLDETSWLAATAMHPTVLVTGVVDLDRGQLVDVIPARSATAVESWLASKPTRWAERIRHAMIDPYQPYATALANEVPGAKLVVDHFHLIRLANHALDEVRRRVQHATLGHRGRKGDPLHRIRRRL